MGNFDSNTFCDCENPNDSKYEASFKTNQNSDKMVCPFINTTIYQNFNIDNNGNKKKNNNNSKTQLKEVNFSKNKSKFDPNNCEMNFEYHTSKSNLLKDGNKLKNKNKSFFNLNPNTNYDKNSLNDIDINNNNNINDNINNNNDNNNYNINDNNNDNDNNFNYNMNNNNYNEYDESNNNNNNVNKIFTITCN